MPNPAKINKSTITGEHFFAGGDFAATDPIVGNTGIVASGQYRDIPRSILADYTAGRISEEKALSLIKGTPVFNPSIGPQVDYGQGRVPFTGTFTPPKVSPITSDILSPQPDLSKAIVSPILPPVPTVPAPTPIPETALTGEAKTAQELSERIRKLYTETAGKEAFRIQEQQQQDIAGKQAIVRDLTNQILAIKAQEAKIPLELELGAAGRGITTTILGRQQQELLRQNAIKALTVQVQLSAAQGDLQTALDMVDRLVDAKYKPLEAEHDALVANYNIIIKSPKFTTEEKDRAITLKREEERKDRERDVSKNVTSQIMTILADPEFQITAPASVKNELSKLAQKIDLTQADAVYAQNLGARYKKAIPTVDPLKVIEYERANIIVRDNFDASYEELFNGILQNTRLTSAETTAYLASKNKVKEKITSVPPNVLGNVEALKANNASLKDIQDYIVFSGYSLDDPKIKKTLSGYSPKKKWWQFWK